MHVRDFMRLFVGKKKPMMHCKYCDQAWYTVEECLDSYRHLWEVHGIPCRGHCNGRDFHFGPKFKPLFLALAWFRTRWPRNVK